MVKCKHCGTENNVDESPFCQNCLEPLPANIAEQPDGGGQSSQPTAGGGSQRPDESVFVTPSIIPTLAGESAGSDPGESQSDQHQNPDGRPELDRSFEIKEVTPVEQALAETSRQVPVDEMPGSQPSARDRYNPREADPVVPEPIENELTLYRDGLMQIKMEQTDHGPEITVSNRENPSDPPDIHGLFGESVPKSFTDPRNPAAGHGANEITPENVSETLPPSPEEIEMTQRIIVNPNLEKKLRTTPLDSGETTAEPTPHEPVPVSAATLVQSAGVAYLEHNSIKFVGGFKPYLGDHVTIGNRVFQLKEKPSRSLALYGAIGGAALLLVIIIFALLGAGKSGQGQIVGILTDNGLPVIGAEIRIKELDLTTKTNEAGFFVFDMIPAGMYSVTVRSNGADVLDDRTPVLDKKTSTVSFAYPAPSHRDDIKPSTPPEAGPRESDRPLPAKDYGSLKLNLSPADAKVYLDGKYLGQGSQTFKVLSGEHVVSVKSTGYKERTEVVSVLTKKTQTMEFILQVNPKSETKTQISPLEEAADLERNGRYSEALTYYHRALASNENNLDALLGAGRCYRATVNSEQALTSFLKAARVAANTGNMAAQLEALTGVLDINPNYLTARFSRGQLYLQRGDYRNAAQDFTKVLEIDKRHLEAYYKLGETYYRAQNYSAALKAYQNIQEINFTDPKPYAYMAQVYWKMDDKKNAKKYYERFENEADLVSRSKIESDPAWQTFKEAINK